MMLASMLAATGPKAFIMAMVIPLSQSAISFLLDAVWGRRKGNRDDRRRPFREEDYPEDAAGFAAGGRGNGYRSRRSSSNYYEGRRRTSNYQSSVSNNFAGAASTGVGADGNTKSSSSGYGGWDELLDNDTAAQETKRRSSFSAGTTDQSTKSQPSATGEEDADYTATPSTRTRMRRRRTPGTMGLGSTMYKQAPLVMRLLVAVFPFLGSWFRLL